MTDLPASIPTNPARDAWEASRINSVTDTPTGAVGSVAPTDRDLTLNQIKLGAFVAVNLALIGGVVFGARKTRILSAGAIAAETAFLANDILGKGK